MPMLARYAWTEGSCACNAAYRALLLTYLAALHRSLFLGCTPRLLQQLLLSLLLLQRVAGPVAVAP